MYDIFVVKHSNKNYSEITERFPHSKTVEFDLDRKRLLKTIALQSVTKHAWVISDNCNYDEFDFEFIPPWHQEDQMHVWPTENQSQGGDTFLINVGTYLEQVELLDEVQNFKDICWKSQKVKQQIKPEVFVWSRSPTADMIVDDPKFMRYIGDPLTMLKKTIRRATTPYIWIVSDECDYATFDFSWRPEWATEKYLHVWPTENQTLGGDTYFVNVDEFKKQQDKIEKLDEYQTIYWHDKQVAQINKPQLFIWDSGNAEPLKQKYPDATVIRQIGTKFDMVKKTVQKSSTPYAWVLSDICNYDNFDFTWRPGWATEKYLHVWPTENQTLGGDTFYINTAEFKKQSIEIDNLLDYKTINWHANTIPLQIDNEVFIWDSGNADQAKEKFPDAVVLRSIGNSFDMLKRTVSKATTANIWIIDDNCDYSNFDFKYRPGWDNEMQLHVWPTGNQVQGGNTFYVNVAEFKKQSIGIDTLLDYNTINWHLDNKLKQIISDEVFIWDEGNTHNLCLQFPDAKVLRAIGSKHDMLNKTIRNATTANIWILNSRCDYSKFDMLWKPDWATEKYLHVWPTENQTMGGDTFYVNVAEYKKQQLSIETLNDYEVIQWHNDTIPEISPPTVVVWDSGNANELKERFADAVVLRNIGSPTEMLKKSLRNVNTKNFWVISDNCDYSNFEFDWRPGWDTETYLHVWPTENQTLGGDTYFVNTAELKKQSIDLDNILNYKTIKWHKEGVKEKQQLPMVVLDSGNTTNVELIKQQFKNVTVLRNIGDRLHMLKKAIEKVDGAYVWIISDKCDYSGFDFTWRPGWDTRTHLHVWATNNQYMGGDTYFVNTAEFKKQSIEIESLSEYNTISWHSSSIVEITEPEVVIWDSGKADTLKKKFPTAKVYRNIGSRYDMMNKTMRNVSTANAWIVSDACDYTDFDFNWRPDWATEQHIHVWANGNQTKGGDTYFVNTAEYCKQSLDIESLDEFDAITWHKESVAFAEDIDIVIWDSGNAENLKKQFPDAKVYRNIGSRYDMMNKTMRNVSTSNVWIISDKCDYNNFDFTWRPDWATEKHIHVWPTAKQIKGGDTYFVNTSEYRKQSIEISSLEEFDAITWHKESVPAAFDPEIVIWDSGNSDHLKQQFPDATVIRNIGDRSSMMAKTMQRVKSSYAWILNTKCDYTNFDFSWRPDWESETHLHVWPTGEQTKGGDTYFVNTIEYKKQSMEINSIDQYNAITWHKEIVNEKLTPEIVIWDSGNSNQLKKQFPDAKVLRHVGTRTEMMNKTVRQTAANNLWILSSKCDYSKFNFLWRPDWATETHLHVWANGNQVKGGDTYFVNAVEYKKQSMEIDSIDQYDAITWHADGTVVTEDPAVVIWDSGNSEHLKQQFPNAVVLRNIGSRFDMMNKTIRKVDTENVWVLSSKCDYTDFNFDWLPGWATEKHIHVWPTAKQIKGGDTYFVNTIEYKKQQLTINAIEEFDAITWMKDSVNEKVHPEIVIWDSGKNNDNVERLKTKFPTATVIRNVGARLEMFTKTARKVESSNAWIISSKCEYDGFDFSWRPGWESEKHIHVWPTGKQTKGGDTYFADLNEIRKQSVEISVIEEFDAITWHDKSVPEAGVADIVIWNFGGNDNNYDSLIKRFPHAKTLRYIGTHLDMIKKSAKYATGDFFWVLSDCCDYTDFKVSWRPDWENEKSIHVWASGTQEFGDTFYVPKADFLTEADSLEKLEYYSSIIWHKDGYARYPWPVNYVDSEDLFTTLKNHKFSTIYEYFVMPGSTFNSTVEPSLWEKRLLIAYNKNGHVSLCPRDCISEISTKVRDYLYIKYHKCENSTQKPQDIVFISYDEINADLNYKKLKDQQPNATRLHGIEGMVNALKTAANNSTTPWFYAVFAKTEVADDFKFDFKPNYLDTPGNYIFQCHNRITDYTYGHGAVVLYHSKTVAEATEWGFDFTTSFPYTYIPLLSCYNDAKDSWEAWRTSFREVLKLREFKDVESEYRMHRWLTVGNGPVGDWSIKGAEDALNYRGSLKEANDWHWLRNYFTAKHGHSQ